MTNKRSICITVVCPTQGGGGGGAGFLLYGNVEFAFADQRDFRHNINESFKH